MGQTILAPGDAGEVFEAVGDALASGLSLELVAGGSRRGFGRPVEAQAVLDLSRLSGVIDYQPEELVLTVAPGTPMGELKALLAERGQSLAFEPPDFGPLWGGAPGQGTIGGAMMAGRGGPRRLVAGGPRDHFLGVKGVNGFGDAFAAGGRVVKNVTGFDLTKLLAGSFGTLAVVTEMTLKVLPAAPDAAILMLLGFDAGDAIKALSQAMGGRAAVTGAAHLPADVASRSQIPAVADAGAGATLLRLEGVTPSLVAGLDHLRDLLDGLAPTLVLDAAETAALWREVADAAYFAGSEDRVVWSLSVPPSRAAALGSALAAELAGRCFYDWAGGAIWLEASAAPDAHAAIVRERLAAAVGRDGHATLISAPAAVRAAIPPFQPQEPGLAALSARVKAQFDPHGLFNPGRMYGGQ
jgi:glycolate oxidase FAD binding subunit